MTDNLVQSFYVFEMHGHELVENYGYMSEKCFVVMVECCNWRESNAFVIKMEQTYGLSLWRGIAFGIILHMREPLQ